MSQFVHKMLKTRLLSDEAMEHLNSIKGIFNQNDYESLNNVFRPKHKGFNWIVPSLNPMPLQQVFKPGVIDALRSVLTKLNPNIPVVFGSSLPYRLTDQRRKTEQEYGSDAGKFVPYRDPLQMENMAFVDELDEPQILKPTGYRGKLLFDKEAPTRFAPANNKDTQDFELQQYEPFVVSRGITPSNQPATFGGVYSDQLNQYGNNKLESTLIHEATHGHQFNKYPHNRFNNDIPYDQDPIEQEANDVPRKIMPFLYRMFR